MLSQQSNTNWASVFSKENKPKTYMVRWFPIIPFLAYWVSTFILRIIGPYYHNRLETKTYIYLFLCMFLFVFFYFNNVKNTFRLFKNPHKYQVIKAYNWLKWTALFSLIGESGFIIDRLITGAGSISKTLYETEYVRAYYNQNTSILTTISVIPQSLLFIALTTYFYCISYRLKIKKWIHICIILQLLLIVFNSFLMTDRGSIFWILTYLAFYVFFVRGASIKKFLIARDYLIIRTILSVGIAILCIYSFFIAQKRNEKSVIRDLIVLSDINRRYPINIKKPENEAAFYQLVQYGTHEYDYIDAFVRNGEILAFRPDSFFGMRFYLQIARFIPDYIPKGKRIALEWMEKEGLSPSGWPSVFGCTIPFFGFLGSFIFFAIVGGFTGRMVRRYNNHGEFGALLIIFCLYSGLNRSFDWIFGDFSQLAGFLIGGYLLSKNIFHTKNVTESIAAFRAEQ